MPHLLLRDKTYYFNRIVPKQFREHDSRDFVRFSLRTDSHQAAKKLAEAKNEELERYWLSLTETGIKHSHEYFNQVVKRASLIGFSYLPARQLADSKLHELIERLEYLQNQLTQSQVEAVLGGVDEPEIYLDDALNKFWDLSNDIVLSKSANQVRKWKNPRKYAVSNLIACVGNKPINSLTRQDLLKLRSWWIAKIEEENLGTNGANKNFIQLKVIIKTVCENYKIKIDLDYIFGNLLFDDEYVPRPAFSTGHIKDVLLNTEKLKGMNDVAQSFLKIFAETGVCFAEQSTILPEDIILDAEIPHIKIVRRKKSKLKTKYRERIIPLVGFALECYQANPLGFSHLDILPDALSSSVNKYLRENNMLPTERHSVYSLRHSFYQRLLKDKALDQEQADLMGHKFDRPNYGKSDLKDLYQVLKQIQLKDR